MYLVLLPRQDRVVHMLLSLALDWKHCHIDTGMWCDEVLHCTADTTSGGFPQYHCAEYHRLRYFGLSTHNWHSNEPSRLSNSLEHFLQLKISWTSDNNKAYSIYTHRNTGLESSTDTSDRASSQLKVDLRTKNSETFRARPNQKYFLSASYSSLFLSL